ncbi:MAG: hypothetical protein NZ761_00390 [Dehalococcoidia bacterium]|nr:hypothetical protein [Dehalococcoidia bacterium]
MSDRGSSVARWTPRKTRRVRSALRGVTAWARAGWKGHRLAVVAVSLALALASVPVLAGPGVFGDSGDGRLGNAAVADETERAAFVVRADESVEAAASETAEPAVPTEPTATTDPTEAVEPSATTEPTETVEPTEPVEPTGAAEPTETVEPSPTTDPTEPVVSPVREVARDNHGAVVSETARSRDGAGTHGEQVRAVARDNHRRAVSETAKGGWHGAYGRLPSARGCPYRTRCRGAGSGLVEWRGWEQGPSG